MVCFQNVQERPTTACTRLGVAHLQFGRGWLRGLVGGSAGFHWTQRRAGDAGRSADASLHFTSLASAERGGGSPAAPLC
jgi:hypothetical protein